MWIYSNQRLFQHIISIEFKSSRNKLWPSIETTVGTVSKILPPSGHSNKVPVVHDKGRATEAVVTGRPSGCRHGRVDQICCAFLVGRIRNILGSHWSGVPILTLTIVIIKFVTVIIVVICVIICFIVVPIGIRISRGSCRNHAGLWGFDPGCWASRRASRPTSGLHDCDHYDDSDDHCCHASSDCSSHDGTVLSCRGRGWLLWWLACNM